jgi:HEAT repeat protein
VRALAVVRLPPQARRAIAPALLTTLALASLLALAACGGGPEGPDLPGLIADLKSSDAKKSGEARLELISLGEVAAPALIDLLQNGSPADKVLAATTIWGMGARAASAAPALATALGDPDPELRVTAAMALENMGPAAAEAVPALTKALHDRERPVRQAAVKALGAMGPAASAALPTLEREIERESWPEAEEAVRRIHGADDAPAEAGQ